MEQKNFERATCEICGKVFENPTPETLAEHMFFDHPLDLLNNRAFQKRLFGVMETVGGQLADFIKRKFENGRISGKDRGGN